MWGYLRDRVTFYNAAASPVVLQAGRTDRHYLNPYSGEIYQPHSEALENFFSTVTAWHRWFNVSGDARSSARTITGVCNLLFLFLVLSGLYLWFHPNATSGSARDYNWHHVFGFWAALPLAVIVATATVFNYSWANNLVSWCFRGNAGE